MNPDSGIYQHLWQYNFTQMQLTLIDAGNIQIYGHSMKSFPSLNSLLIFFGYRMSSPRTFSNSIYQYSFDSPCNGWNIVSVKGVLPAGREYISDGYNPVTGEYFLFGGDSTAGYGNMSLCDYQIIY